MKNPNSARRIFGLAMGLTLAFILAACGGSSSATNPTTERQPYISNPAVLPPLETPAAEQLADDTNIAVGAGTETLADLSADTYPYDGAVEIPASDANHHLASAWRLLPSYPACVQNCDSSGSKVYVTVGIVYKADGDKLVASFYNFETPGDEDTPVIGATAVTWTAPSKSDVTTALGLGGDGHQITLAHYNGEFDGQTPEYLIAFFEAGDEIDTLIFQNQYSMLSFWLYPQIDLVAQFNENPLGLPAPSAQVPSSGSVNYAGIAAGYLFDFEDEEVTDNFFVYGDSSFAADFGRGMLSGNITVSAYRTSDLKRKLGEAAFSFGAAQGALGLEFSGLPIQSDGGFYDSAGNSLAYSSGQNANDLGIFSGFKADSADALSDDVSSDMDGRFFGPNAAEIAGKIEVGKGEDSLSLELLFTADRQ